jgi:hypothetical protein
VIDFFRVGQFSTPTGRPFESKVIGNFAEIPLQ